MKKLLQQVSETLYQLANNAGDVPEWNEGGHAYETSQAVKAALAAIEAPAAVLPPCTTYVIKGTFSRTLPIGQFVKRLQTAYDEGGVAGHFEVMSGDTSSWYVTFTRDLEDDREHAEKLDPNLKVGLAKQLELELREAGMTIPFALFDVELS